MIRIFLNHLTTKLFSLAVWARGYFFAGLGDEANGFFREFMRYREGIVVLSSLMIIGISIASIVPVVSSLEDKDRGPYDIVVIGPSGEVEFFSENTTVGDALARWGIQLDEMRPEVLSAPIFSGSRISVISHDGLRSIRITPLSGRERFILGIPIDINNAKAFDLDLIPGVGEKTAEKIIAYRDTHGPFSSVDDLKDVPGLGPKRTSLIGRYVVFGDRDVDK